jgi:hypothetical protein
MNRHVPRSAATPVPTIADWVQWVRRSLHALLENGETLRIAPPAPTHELERIARCLSLSREDVLVLAFVGAAAIDPDVPSLCARLHGSAVRSYPSFELAFRLFPSAQWSVLTGNSPLRYWRLIEIHQAAAEPLLSAGLRLDESIADRLMGCAGPDERVAAVVSSVVLPAGTAIPSVAAAVDRVRQHLAAAGSRIALAGGDVGAKLEVAARSAEGPLWQVKSALLANLGTDGDAFARLLLREMRLHEAALYLDLSGANLDDGATAATLQRFVEQLAGATVFLAAPQVPPAMGQMLRVDVDRPSAPEQYTAWQAAMPAADIALLERLAGQFRLDTATIARIGSAGAAEPERVWIAARDAARPEASGLATRIDASARWDDLILPAAQRALLGEIAAQVAQRWLVYDKWGFATRLNRGLGIAALFAGESGTGKTMAAEVIANAVGLDLYRVDLATVVSKYVGETEKNLKQVFDGFEDGGAVLLFDEADALFGRRSEVKDSHDRYANIEINYLLQRLEGYRGLAILATNRRSALDGAFLRRLRFIVDFPFPGLAERREIWKRAFPPPVKGSPSVDTSALDFDRLARTVLAGGNIQQAAINASFRAAADGTASISMAHALHALRAELVKLEIPFNEADFDPMGSGR